MSKSVLKLALVLVVALNFAASAFAQSLVPQKDDKKNLWGYVDTSTGKWVVKPKYDAASEFKTQPNGKSRAVVTTKGLSGFMDESGKLLGAGAVFEKMQPLEGDAMFVTVKGKTGVANYDGVYLVKPEADAVEQLGAEGWVTIVKGKKGLLKNDGSYLLQPIYTEIDPSVPGYFVVSAGGKSGLLRRDGSEVVAPKQYSALQPLRDKIWKVSKGNKCGLMDVSTGAIVVEPNYENIIGSYLANKFFIVRKGKHIDILNQSGNRRMRYSNYDDIKVYEDSVDGKLLLVLDNETFRLFNGSDAKSYKINIRPERCYDFQRLLYSLADGEKSDEVAAYLAESQAYQTLDNQPTPYVHAQYLLGDLYVMEDKSGNAYLFKGGSNQPIGQLVRENPNKPIAVADTYELVSGETIDKNGNKIEQIKYDGKVVATKDVATGKYSITAKPDQLYDAVTLSRRVRQDRNQYYGILASRDGKVYALNEYGNPFAESGDDGLLKFDNLSTGIYTVIVDRNCKFGLQKDGQTVLAPEYDDLYMIILYNQDGNYYGNKQASFLFKLYKDGKGALYDVKNKKMLVPFEKGYDGVGGTYPEDFLHERMYDSGLCYVRMGENTTSETSTAFGLYNFKLGKELIAPKVGNKISALPIGYKGYEYEGVVYAPDGSKLKLPVSINAERVEWENHMPKFDISLAGLEGRTVKFYVTVYDRNGNVYRDSYGNKCIVEQGHDITPNKAVVKLEKFPFFLGDYVHLRPYSSIDLKYVLTAKDAKTGAAIPVKGATSITQTWERGR